MLYLAYGSNLFTKRLKGRVPSAVKLREVELPNYQLSFHKKAGDRSAKCNIREVNNSSIYGIIYRLEAEEKPDLDKIEGPGYNVDYLQIDSDNESREVFTYLAAENYIDDSLKPYSWYKSIVIAGAEEHNLPQEYIRKIKEVKSVPDPDRERARRELSILE